MEHLPKRNKPDADLPHREKIKVGGSIFKGYTFSFPIVDIELTPKQIDILSDNISKEGGRVVKFVGKVVETPIDFIAVNPKLPIESVQEKIKGKLSYREIIDYHFVTDSLKADKLQNFERYSLFINIEEL